MGIGRSLFLVGRINTGADSLTVLLFILFCTGFLLFPPNPQAVGGATAEVLRLGVGLLFFFLNQFSLRDIFLNFLSTKPSSPSLWRFLSFLASLSRALL